MVLEPFFEAESDLPTRHQKAEGLAGLLAQSLDTERLQLPFQPETREVLLTWNPFQSGWANLLDQIPCVAAQLYELLVFNPPLSVDLVYYKLRVRTNERLTHVTWTFSSRLLCDQL